MTTKHHSERGSVTLETVIVIPALLLILTALLFAGRVAIAHQAAQAAAADAARAASISRTRPAAEHAARSSATSTLANQQLRCSSTTVALDTSAFAAPVGTPGQVRATVTCVVALGDLTIPGIPGSRTITETATSPLDTYRERQ